MVSSVGVVRLCAIVVLFLGVVRASIVVFVAIRRVRVSCGLCEH